jgi:toxin ParE1/3/4
VTTYQLTDAARRQLREIRLFSLDRWGKAVTKKYMEGFKAAFEKIAEDFERSGTSADFVRTGYRRRRVGRHVIFYRMRDTIVQIVGILHQRQEPRRYL